MSEYFKRCIGCVLRGMGTTCRIKGIYPRDSETCQAIREAHRIGELDGKREFAKAFFQAESMEMIGTTLLMNSTQWEFIDRIILTNDDTLHCKIFVEE